MIQHIRSKLIFIICLIFPLLASCSFYHSQFDGLGSFLSSPDDGEFAAQKVPSDKALIYVYRPNTQWSMDEIEAPSLYINDERIFGVKGGSYTFYYLIPGDYDVVLRRPLMGLEGIAGFNWHKAADFAIQVKAGKTYYFRYSELNRVRLKNKSQPLPEGDGPLARVPKNVALAEIKNTQLLHRSGDTLEPIEEEPETPEETKEQSSIWSWWPF